MVYAEFVYGYKKTKFLIWKIDLLKTCKILPNTYNQFYTKKTYNLVILNDYKRSFSLYRNENLVIFKKVCFIQKDFFRNLQKCILWTQKYLFNFII